jgi:hypothetical protein
MNDISLKYNYDGWIGKTADGDIFTITYMPIHFTPEDYSAEFPYSLHASEGERNESGDLDFVEVGRYRTAIEAFKAAENLEPCIQHQEGE